MLLGCAGGRGECEGAGFRNRWKSPEKNSGWAQRGEKIRCQSSNGPPPHPSTSLIASHTRLQCPFGLQFCSFQTHFLGGPFPLLLWPRTPFPQPFPGPPSGRELPAQARPSESITVAAPAPLT